MDEYQEMERFGLDNDYEGGRFINGEFYYKKRKDKHVQSKDEVTYGVFASGSSDSDYDYDDDDNLTKKKKKKRKKGGLIMKADYSEPVMFVSSGVGVGSRDGEVKDGVDEGDGSDAGFRAGLGSGQSGGGAGLGFGSGQNGGGAGLGFGSSSSNQGGRDEEEDGEEKYLPTAFGKTIKERAEKRREKKDSSGGGKMKEGVRRGSEVFGGESGLGSGFERHSKGIGLKLLEKMGYKGGGLGKNAQGIVAPIEVKVRPKSMGMGFNDYEERKSMPSLAADVPQPQVEDKVVVENNKEKGWKKNARARAKKKENIITPDELLAMKEELEEETVFQKVLDMRGPQVRVLSNLNNLNAEEKARESDVPMPELQYNIRLIVDQAELEIQKKDRELRNERETVVALQREKEKLQNDAAQQMKQINSMEEIMGVLDRISEENTSGRLTLESLTMSFRALQRRFAEDYKVCDLSCIACSYALPLLIRVFQGWDPLQNPMHGIDVLASWRSLLVGDEERDIFDDASSPYAQLVNEVVFPAVRIVGINTWEARDPERMLRFLEAWEKLLPPSVLQSILDMIVMPKLSDAVNSWDPCRETIPIHVWVHPWLPLLGQKLEVLYQAIRIKLGYVLQAWHPSDSSAYTILSPWKTVFDTASWEQLIVRSILPKLINVMQEFQVHPGNQNLDPFNWVMNWASAVPIHHMVSLLEIHFFSKWQQALYLWLCSNPDFEQVMQWFLGWKGSIPAELSASERIRTQFNMALGMIDQAVEGLQVVAPGLRENISYLRAREQRQFDATAARAQQQNPVGAATTDDGPEMSFKEVIEAYAQQHGLLFKPKPGRLHNGHQMYGFGTVSIYVDSLNGKVFAQVQDQWSLVSLQQLLQMQNTSSSRRR